jgi:hypothetical protein
MEPVWFRTEDPQSTPAGDNSPFRRICKPSLECRRVLRRAKTVADTIGLQIDVHIPLKQGIIEPFEDFYGGFVERQSDLERKVSIEVG